MTFIMDNLPMLGPKKVRSRSACLGGIGNIRGSENVRAMLVRAGDYAAI